MGKRIASMVFVGVLVFLGILCVGTGGQTIGLAALFTAGLIAVEEE